MILIISCWFRLLLFELLLLLQVLNKYKIIRNECFRYCSFSFTRRNGVLDAVVPYGVYPSLLDYTGCFRYDAAKKNL